MLGGTILSAKQFLNDDGEKIFPCAEDRSLQIS